MFEAINWTFHVFFMLFFLVLGVGLLWRAGRERRHWEKAADVYNMIFQEKGSKRLCDIQNRFCLLTATVVDEPTEMLAGTHRGREVMAFNWYYQSEASLTSKRSGFACVMVRLKQTQQWMHTFSESLAEYVPNLGQEQMVLEAQPFSQRYRLFSRDRKSATRMLSNQVKTILLEGEYWLEISEDLLLLGHAGVWEPHTVAEGIVRIYKLAEEID